HPEHVAASRGGRVGQALQGLDEADRCNEVKQDDEVQAHSWSPPRDSRLSPSRGAPVFEGSNFPLIQPIFSASFDTGKRIAAAIAPTIRVLPRPSSVKRSAIAAPTKIAPT